MSSAMMGWGGVGWGCYLHLPSTPLDFLLHLHIILTLRSSLFTCSHMMGRGGAGQGGDVAFACLLRC